MDRRAAIGLVALGTLSALNSAVASAAGAEKSIDMHRFVNTHWITIVQLFAGMAHLMSDPKEVFSSVLSLSMSLIAAAVCACASVTDVLNLAYLWELGKSDNKLLMQRLLSYSAVDGLLSIACLPLCVLVAVTWIKEETNLPHDSRSPRLQVLGVVQIALSVSRLFTFFVELYWLQAVSAGGKLRLLFVNYTIDEPMWLCINIVIGALTVLAGRGGRVVRGACLALCASTVFPCIFYIWLDYRWYSSVFLATASKQRPHSSPLISTGISLGFMHIVVLIATALSLFAQLSPQSRMKLDARVRNLFMGCAIILVMLSLSAISIDLYALHKQIFYQLFHGSEQKTPFLLALTAVFAALSASPSVAVFALPACLTCCVLTVNSTLFMLFSYVYLSFNGYFGETLCDLFFPTSAQCFQPVTRSGAALHFLEALIHFISLLLCGLLAAGILRIARMRPADADPTPVTERKERRMEGIVRTLGIVMALCGVAVLATTLSGYIQLKDESHPLVVVYLSLFHVAVAVALVVFPTLQIILSDRIAQFPLARHAVSMMCAVRFTDILSQMDYRGTGEALSLAWKTHQTAEVVSLFCLFFTIVCLNRIRSGEQSEAGVAMQFDNPLAGSTQEEGVGYLQLRQEEI